MAFTQIKRIKEIDQTPEQAIATYGSFVKLYEDTQARIAKKSGKGWCGDRSLLCRANQSLPTLHLAIADKFGLEVVSQAMTAHPFK